MNLLEIFSRKLFCGAIRPFLEAAGLITGAVCRLRPFCYVIVIIEGGVTPGRLLTQCLPRQHHAAEMFECTLYFNPLSIDTEYETAKELGEHSNKLVTKALDLIYSAIMSKVCPTIASSN